MRDSMFVATKVNWHEVWLYIVINFKSLYHSLPTLLFIILFLIIVVDISLAIFSKKISHKRTIVGLLLLLQYVILLFCITVTLRPEQDTHLFIFMPFWSYHAFIEGQNAVMAEKIVNVTLFIPLGMLLPIAFREIKWYNVLLISVLISISIEVMQFVLYRGYSEVDDVIHNTLGALIGLGLYGLFVGIIKRMRNAYQSNHSG